MTQEHGPIADRFKEVIFLGMTQSDIILFRVYEFLSAFLPFLITFSLFARFWHKQAKRIAATSCCFIIIFAVYVIGVYHFTGAGTLYEGMRYQLAIWNHFNGIPFSKGIDPTGYFLNVVLFLPLGMLTPLIWDEMDRFGCVLGIGAAFSLLIEITQILNVRATDIDDLIMNMIGTGIGFGLYQIFDKGTTSRFQQRNVPAAALGICVLMPYIGRFFLYNDMGLARLLYGF